MVDPRLETTVQVAEVSIQMLAVFSGAHSVDSHGDVAPHFPMGLPQMLDGQQVREVRESERSVLPSHSSDPSQFR
jgi:hypothetical protein